MQVPLLDLKAQHDSIRDEVDHAIQKVLRSCAFVGGSFVADFEKALADYCGANWAVGVGSGTMALWLTLLTVGVGPGDEVVTVPNAFVGTAEAITLCGACPVFVDVDAATGTMDPVQLHTFLQFHCKRAQISGALVNLSTGRRIKAVVPVHLHGFVADMDPIMETAAEYDLKVIEDASHAAGALYKGQPAGSLGNAGCFCFNPGQNLGACGQAGAVVTSDPELADIVAALREHGQVHRYGHCAVGWSGHMDGIQGAALGVKLRYLDGWNAARRMVAEQYTRHFGELGNLACPTAAEQARHVYRTYAVRVPDRESFMDDLRRRGVETAVHYPVPIHLQEAYDFLSVEAGDYPAAEAWAAEVVSLPMFPELYFRQVARVIDAVTASRADAGRVYFEKQATA